MRFFTDLICRYTTRIIATLNGTDEKFGWIWGCSAIMQMIGRLSQASHEGKEGELSNHAALTQALFWGGLCCRSLKPCTGEAAQSCASSPIPHIDSLKLNWKLFCKSQDTLGLKLRSSLTFFLDRKPRKPPMNQARLDLGSVG